MLLEKGYAMKPFAGSGARGALDGIPLQARFESPRGIAISPTTCFVSDTDCIRMLSIKGSSLSLKVPFKYVIFSNFI